MKAHDPATPRRTRPHLLSWTTALLFIGVLCTAATTATASTGRLVADDPTRAPSTTISADGRSVTDGTRTLAASQTTGLAPGHTVSVAGSGYDVHKGIYLGVCVIPPTNRPPGPCAGGQDRTGARGDSLWISSNPPSYGDGLARSYGPGGSFSVTIRADPELPGQLDCYSVRCAIVSRNDHIRSSDRSQDLFIPVNFAAPGAPEPPPTAAPTTIPVPTAPPTTPDPARIAPEANVAADGRSVTDGTRTLRASVTRSLDPGHQKIRISGAGFDPRSAVYVALCRVPETNETPGPCTTPPEGALWLTPDPPPTAKSFAQRIDSDGTFSGEIELMAKIDATTDCRKASCAVTVRHDDTAAEDRRADLFLPVTFAARAAPTTTTVAATTTPPSTAPAATTGGADVGGGDGGSPWVWVLATAVVALGGGGAFYALRRRARHTPSGATEATT